MNIENGPVVAGAIQPGWLSAMWKLSFENTVVPPPSAQVAPAPAGPVVPIDPGARQPKGYVPEALALPGTFLITTTRGGRLYARDGGGSDFTTYIPQDLLSSVPPFALLKLWSAGPQYIQYKYISTAKGYFVLALDGGGHADSNAIVADLRQYPYGQYTGLAAFRFVLNRIGNTSGHGAGEFTIQTVNGQFVTAVGGGGQTTNALHTDARTAGESEYFYVRKCGDLGSEFTYGIRGMTFFIAPGGGGQTHQAIKSNVLAGDGTPISHLARFTFIRQSDGSYALRTPNGVNYVTAVNGGGLVQGSATPDILLTNRTQVQAWEKFKIVDDGNCNYTIQTGSGYYLGTNGHGNLSTNISDPNVHGPTLDDYLAKFTLIMFDL